MNAPCLLPDRRSALLPRLLGALAIVLAAATPLALAHEGVAHVAPAAASVPARELQGKLVAITVTNRMSGQMQRVAALDVAGGHRYLLRNATSLQEGATVSVTGRAQGQLLVADAVRTLATAPSAAPKTTVQRATLEGTLRMFHVDYTDGRPAEFGYSLVTDSGKPNIVDLGTMLPMLQNGMRATISGPVDARGYIAVDTIEIIAPPTLARPRDRVAAAGTPVALTTGYLTMPLNYPTNAAAPWTYNADPFTIASITSSVYGAAPAQSVAEYYKEVSFGAQLITGVVANAGGAWLKATVAKPTACSTSSELNAVLASIESQADAAATAAGFNPGSYTGVLYVINSLPCGWAGLGYIGWERAYAKGTASLGVVGHEFGHNFGLYHAGSLDCGANVIATSGCTVTEYGDPFVIMGNQRSMHLNAFQKELLGYIPGASVATHSSGSTSYTINPIELPGQSKYAVVIPTLSANRTYWLEFRQPIGFDSGMSAFPNNGAQVRVARPFEFNNCSGCTGLYDDTQFLDMTPGTASFTDGTLLAGTSFSDPTYNVLISVTSATPTELTVQVTTGGSVTTTTTSLAGSPNPSTSGQTVTFTATVIGSAPTGGVAFLESGTPLTGCSSVALTGSGDTRTAQCTSSTLATGVHSIVATYGGNVTNSASTSVALSQTVRAATTTTLASSLNPSVAGNSVTLTASVTGAAPTGTVAFTSDAVAIAGCTAVALAGSGNTRTAACTTSALAQGTRAIVANYGGNSANGTSSGNLSQVVNAAPPAPTTTTLVSGANPSLVGAAVTFTASVTGSAPTGNVAFTADGVAIGGCTAIALAGSGNTRTAACTTSALAQGTRAIVAGYGGNGSNAASTSASLSQVVNAAPPAPTTTTLASGANPSLVGAAVTFTASVTGSAPTGNVAFTADGVAIGGCTAIALAGSGNTRTAACTTSALAQGTRAIVAGYGGNGSNAASTSASLSQVVNAAPPAPTTTTLVSGTNPSLVGAAVTFTASVTGSAPTGNVAFTADGVAIGGCTAIALAGSGNTRTAACTTSALAQGTRAIVAGYGGNGSNAASTSASLSQVVNAAPPAPTTTTLASGANPSLVGAAVTFTASVTGSAPTGNVAFTADGVAIGGCTAIALAGSGNTRTAACTTSALAQGTRAIVAGYGGNGSNAASTSASLSQVVNAAPPAPTTTTLASGANPSLVGAAVTFTASVTGSAPTGNVAFTADGVAIGGCTAIALAGSGNTRTAACTTSALAEGSRAIVASYGGNAGNSGSTSTTLNQIVNPSTAPATRTTVTSALNPVPVGTPPQWTATIASVPPVDGGTVSFTGNGTPIAGCQGLPLSTVGSARSATCSAVGLAAGAYSVVASYSGHPSGQPSTSPVFSQVVSHLQIGNTVQFAAASHVVNEAAGTVAVGVTRIGDVSLPASVTYSMSVGTATGADFSSSAGTLAWGPGDSTPRAVVVPIANDGIAEPSETFTLNLSGPVGASLGAVATTTVTIADDESALANMPGLASVVQNPYGTLTVQGGTLSGASISTLSKSAVIQLGNVAGAAGSFAKIDFANLNLGAGNTLVVRAGAPGQSVYLVNASGAAASIAGMLEAQAGAGAPPPVLYVQSPAGLTIVAGGSVVAPAGLTLDTLDGTPASGQPIVNHGIADGGSSLQLLAARVGGGGMFKGNDVLLSTFGNANNPVNGAHFLANGLHFHPGSGSDLALTLSAYGGAPQFLNLMLHGNATVAMPSAWPVGSPLPPNNRPVMPGEIRAAGVPDPAYGGGSMIVQATGTLALAGGTRGDFVFPGGIVLKSGGELDVKGTSVDNAWTTSGASFQGVFMEAPSITDTGPTARIDVRTNNLNWANVMPRPLVPVRTWTLQRLPDGTAQLQAADGVAPHLNFYSISSEAGAAGTCYVCLVNPQVVDMTIVP